MDVSFEMDSLMCYLDDFWSFWSLLTWTPVFFLGSLVWDSGHWKTLWPTNPFRLIVCESCSGLNQLSVYALNSSLLTLLSSLWVLVPDSGFSVLWVLVPDSVLCGLWVLDPYQYVVGFSPRPAHRKPSVALIRSLLQTHQRLWDDSAALPVCLPVCLPPGLSDQSVSPPDWIWSRKL